MSGRLSWRDAERSAEWLQSKPGHRRTLLFIAQLPFVPERVLERLAGVRGGASIYRSLARLRETGLVASITPSLSPGRSPDLFYLTDLGLGTIAIDRDIDLAHLVRQLHLRDTDLLSLLPGLSQLVATYDLLGALAASQEGQPRLLAWERPWRRRYQRPTAKAPISVTLPAYAALSWDGTTGAYLLIPDLGSFPLRLYRPTLDHLMRMRHMRERAFPILIVATPGQRRMAVWEKLLEEVWRARLEIPLLACLTTWGGLGTGLARLEQLGEVQQMPEEHLIQRIRWQPLRRRQGNRPLPRPVGDALAASARSTVAEGLGRIALTLSPADRSLLDLVACHPFLPRERLSTVLGWQDERVRVRRNRLIARGLMRLVGADEAENHALQELVEATVEGLELVAAQRDLSLAVAVRELGLTGGGPEQPIGARRKLLQHLPHTLGANAVFVSLYRTARQLAAKGHDDAVVEWRNAAACSRRHLRPDGYGLYQHEGWLHSFFLEYDRGSLNARDYFKKLAAYYDYGIKRRFERDYPGFPTILVVASDNATERRIGSVVQEAATGRGFKLPLLLTSRWRIDDTQNPYGLLGAIWREPDADFNDRRFWLPEPTGLLSLTLPETVIPATRAKRRKTTSSMIESGMDRSIKCQILS
jgi:hypothetical protein